MENIKVVSVTLKDVEILQKIGRQTLFETFESTNSKENMAKYLDEGFSVKNEF